MAKFTIGSGIDDYIETLNNLDLNTDKILGQSVYEGAKVVADAVKRNIEALPVSNSKRRGTAEHQIDSITTAQKNGLLQGFGISRIRNDGGYVNVKLGFAGYNSQISTTAKKAGWTTTKQANSMIARSVENGTYFRKKHPFVAPAVRATKSAAEKAMADALDKEIEKTMR